MVFLLIHVSFPVWITYTVLSYSLIHLLSWWMCIEHLPCSYNWGRHWNAGRYPALWKLPFYWNSQHIPLWFCLLTVWEMTFNWLCHQGLVWAFLDLHFYSGCFSKDQRQWTPAFPFVHWGWDLKDLHNLLLPDSQGGQRSVLLECFEAEEPP